LAAVRLARWYPWLVLPSVAVLSQIAQACELRHSLGIDPGQAKHQRFDASERQIAGLEPGGHSPEASMEAINHLAASQAVGAL